jgi:hypothetical protein
MRMGDETAEPKDDRLTKAFGKLTEDERHMLTSALAGNFPECFNKLRVPVIRALMEADSATLRALQQEAEQQGAQRDAI